MHGEHPVLEYPCGQSLEGHHEEGDRNDQLESIRGEFDETNCTVDEAPVSFTVVLD